jgi:hypothetical protein
MLASVEYWYSFGGGDYGESYFEMEISDEEYRRIQEAEESGEEFDECEAVADIYKRAYKLADEDATGNLTADGIIEKGMRAGSRYPITVRYPYVWIKEEA